MKIGQGKSSSGIKQRANRSNQSSSSSVDNSQNNRGNMKNIKPPSFTTLDGDDRNRVSPV